MIRPYDRKSQAMWDHGELQVEIRVPTNDRPVAYCDGTDEDEAELQAIAEGEGTELPVIYKRTLKTGRQIWTVGDPPKQTEEEVW